MRGREDLVGDVGVLGRRVPRQDAGPAGLRRILVPSARHQLALRLVGAGLASLVLALGRAALEARLRAGDRALRALGLRLGLLVLLAFRVRVVGIARLGRLAEIDVEILDQLARGAGVGILILEEPLQLVEILADARFEPGPPLLHNRLGGTRRRGAGELLAREKADRLGEGDVRALADALVALAAIALVEHRLEVLRHARHAPRAEALDARLLDRLEDRARRLAGRKPPGMHAVVVVLETERHRIGDAAELRGLGRREVAPRLRQLDPRRREGGPFGAEAHLHVLALGDRAQGRGGRALEDLDRAFFLRRLAQPARPPSSLRPASP